MRRYPDPTPPKATRALATVLPAPLARLACAGVHTYSDDLDDCLVCGRAFPTGRVRALTMRGHRTGRCGTTIHLHLTASTTLHRLQRPRRETYWLATWSRNGDRYEAHLRPHVDFGHRNVSAAIRAERTPDLVFDDD